MVNMKIDQINMSPDDSVKTILELNKFNEIYVYGAGSAFHWVYEILVRNYRIEIAAVIDAKYSNGDVLDGIPCMNFDEFMQQGVPTSSLVIVSIANIETAKKIIEKFSLAGYLNIVRLFDIYEVHDPFQSRGSIDWSKNAEMINEVYDYFEDNQSREIYSSIISTHLSKHPVPLAFDDERTQNFDPEITKNVSYESTLICGCGIHDLEIFISGVRKRKVRRVACFEPEPIIYFGEDNGYPGLLNYIFDQKKKIDFSCIAYPFAVSNTNSVEKFKSANQESGMRTSRTSFGSRLSHDGLSYVQTVSLDHFCQYEKPTALIIDAEGEEINILEGARGVISKNAPSISVAVYHKINHIWETPFLLKEINSAYRLYLRNYTGFCSETILYGVCK